MLCLQLNNSCSSIPLNFGIVLGDSNRSRTNPELNGTIITYFPVRIPDPDMGDVRLWCCYYNSGENTIKISEEEYNLTKIPSEDNII
jgi:hypothetical protein